MTMQLFPQKENAGMMAILFPFFPISPQISFFLLDTMVSGPRLQLQLSEAEMIPRHETICTFNFEVRISKDLR